LNGVKGYDEKEMDRMYDLKTMESEVVRNEEVIYAQAHYRSWPS
jgi:hypothetical protein